MGFLFLRVINGVWKEFLDNFIKSMKNKSTIQCLVLVNLWIIYQSIVKWKFSYIINETILIKFVVGTIQREIIYSTKKSLALNCHYNKLICRRFIICYSDILFKWMASESGEGSFLNSFSADFIFASSCVDDFMNFCWASKKENVVNCLILIRPKKGNNLRWNWPNQR